MKGRYWPGALIRPDRKVTSATASKADDRAGVSAETSVRAEVEVNSRNVSAETRMTGG